MRRVIVTGAAGYIGSQVCIDLVHKGFNVVGVDSLNYSGLGLLSLLHSPNFEFCNLDLRDHQAVSMILSGAYAVIHLAAIVGDPACKKNPDLAKAINVDASKHLIESAIKSGVNRFIFSSTCSNYGRSVHEVDETAPLRPVSLYAESKVEIERELLTLTKEVSLVPTVLRFATVYGISPRMRFDLTVNEFVRDVAMGRELVIFGEQFWRPYCHVRDISKAIGDVLQSPEEVVNREVFNVGASAENYTKKMISEILINLEPKAKIQFVKQEDDPRDYKVSFSKIKSKLGFVPDFEVPKTMEIMMNLIKMGVFKNVDDEIYKNI